MIVQASQTWHHTQWIWTISWKIIFSPLYGYFVCKIHGSLLGMIINDVLAEVLLILASVVKIRQIAYPYTKFFLRIRISTDTSFFNQNIFF